MLAAPAPPRERLVHQAPAQPLPESVPEITPQSTTQDNAPRAAEVKPKVESKIEIESEIKSEPKRMEPAIVPAPAAEPAEPVPALESALSAPSPESPPQAAPAPLFRARTDLGNLPVGKPSFDRPPLGKPPGAPIPAVIPILRAPDDPGIDDEAPVDEFTEKIGTPRAQAGGWRGFWTRWGG
jgi:HemY protein